MSSEDPAWLDFLRAITEDHEPGLDAVMSIEGRDLVLTPATALVSAVVGSKVYEKQVYETPLLAFELRIIQVQMAGLFLAMEDVSPGVRQRAANHAHEGLREILYGLSNEVTLARAEEGSDV